MSPTYQRWLIPFCRLLCCWIGITACAVLSSHLLLAEDRFEDGPSAMDVEKRALERRQSLRSGRLQVLVSHWSAGGGGQRVVASLEFQIHFDGDQLRFDGMHTVPYPEGGTPGTRITSKIVASPERWIYHSDDVGPDDRRQSVVMGKPELMESVKIGVFHPLRLGFVPTNATVLHAFRSEDFLGRPDRSKSSLETVVTDAGESFEIEYERLDGVIVRYTIAPSYDYSVTKAETESIHPSEGIVVDRITNTLRQWPSGQVWFPERIDFERTVAGEVVEGETIEIVDAEFNTNVAPEIFTLAGMNIPPGTGILEHPPHPGGSREWNGQEIVPIYRQPVGGSQRSADIRIEGGADRRRAIVIVAVNAVVAAFFAGWYVWRRSRAD